LQGSRNPENTVFCKDFVYEGVGLDQDTDSPKTTIQSLAAVSADRKRFHADGSPGGMSLNDIEDEASRVILDM